MDRLTFLRTSPREIYGIFEQMGERERRMSVPAAMICATLCNLHAEKKAEPYTVADFLPGEESEELTDQEFMEKVMRGESFELDPDAAATFRRKMEAMFSDVKPSVTTDGPRGKEERRIPHEHERTWAD